MKDCTRESYESRIMKVQLFIQRHLEEKLSLHELAHEACFSPYHFHRIFHAMVGEPVKEYVRRLRLERAAFELLYTQRPVTEIAFASGYEAHESFSRAFARNFGQTPSAYRAAKRAEIEPDPVKRRPRFVATILDKEETDMNMDIQVKPFDPIHVAFVRHVGPYPECGQAWMKLCEAPQIQRHLTPEAFFVGISYDNPDITEPEKIRMDCCIAVPKGFEAEGEIHVQTIAGGDYAVHLHKGSYDGLHDKYRRLYGDWLPASGFEAAESPSLEVYLNSPEKVAPEDLLTEIRIPVKAA